MQFGEFGVDGLNLVGRNLVKAHEAIVSTIHSARINNRGLVSKTEEWESLRAEADAMDGLHLRQLMEDDARVDAMYAEHDGIFLDYSRQRATQSTMQLLFALAERQNLREKVAAMMSGHIINTTERRPALHTALRAPRSASIILGDGSDAVASVHEVLDRIEAFAEDFRAGKARGATGKRLKNIIAVGIGGSYLGPEFLAEALRTEEEGSSKGKGFTLRFLSNVDPVDVARCTADLNPQETLVIVISKSFTTAETMLNARTLRQWVLDSMPRKPVGDVVGRHFVACASSSAMERVTGFGIAPNRVFEFWDWVGGRYSVCSSVGVLPIALKFGYPVVQRFLDGARSLDEHFASAPFERNIPVLLGLLGVWNTSFLGYRMRTTLPYAEALLKLPAHIQQVDMESNGKAVTIDGEKIDYLVGEVDFGEPGTNGQHSFFQLLHMGQAVPCDFIGFAESQLPLHVKGEKLSSHDELMANFFAQPDALAIGRTAEEVAAEGCDPELVPHRTFEGNRPSLSLLLSRLDAYSIGQLLALYEHRTAVQGFIWDLNSWDQWGVELGKLLAKDVRDQLERGRGNGAFEQEKVNRSTGRLLKKYLYGLKSEGRPSDLEARAKARENAQKERSAWARLLGVGPEEPRGDSE